MTAFDINVGDKTYKMFFNRDSVRQYEEMGGQLTDMKEKMFITTDRLFYVGLRKFNPHISPAEATEISDKAVQEFGIESVYEPLVNAFMEVFTSGGNNSSTGKKFLATKSQKA